MQEKDQSDSFQQNFHLDALSQSLFLHQKFHLLHCLLIATNETEAGLNHGKYFL